MEFQRGGCALSADGQQIKDQSKSLTSESGSVVGWVSERPSVLKQ